MEGADGGEAVKMQPCPFCEGPPCLTTHLINRRIFEGLHHYPPDGIYIYAVVWCHECGVDGPRAKDFVCSDSDVEALKRTAIELWNQRDNRHRGMYDSGDARGLTEYPRAESR
jgi:Restriction alleviation protein Lar